MPRRSSLLMSSYDTIAQIGQHEFMSMFADDVAEPSYRVSSYTNMTVAIPIRQSNHNNNMHSTIGTYFGLNRSITFLFAAILKVREDTFTLNRVGNLCENCHGLGYMRELDVNRIIDYSVPLFRNPIGAFMTLSFSDLITVLNYMKHDIKEPQIKFALNIIYNFVDKAVELNLGHLYFHRAIPTLSGGELQRLKMVQVFNSQLTDLMIVLDEPLAGLPGEEKNSVFATYLN